MHTSLELTLENSHSSLVRLVACTRRFSRSAWLRRP